MPTWYNLNMKGDYIMDLKQIVSGIAMTKACSIKADKDSNESKVINLKVKFENVSLQAVFDKAVSSAVISWQNGQGRKQFDTLKSNQTVEILFNAPASRSQVDPETAMIAKLQAMSPDEQITYLKELSAKAAK